MSEHQQAQNTAPLNANLVAFIFIFTFTIIGIVIVSNIRPREPHSQEGDSTEVAMAESTASTMSSITSVSPTNTAMPTSTSAPPPTNTPMPTSAAATPALSTTPQTVADAGQTGGVTTAASYDPALVAKGQELFLTCSACHGADALGLPNLGKNLVESEFVHSLSDQDLLTFVKTGRPSWDALNTTGIDMPPKGGNPAFTDDDLLAIITYLRSISVPGGQAAPSSASGAGTTATSVPPTPVPTSAAAATATRVPATPMPTSTVAATAVSVPPTPVPDSGAEATASIGASAAYDPALVSQGEELFLTCSACHGADARGLPNLGKNLVESEFVHSLSDQDLLTFVKTGRPSWDALNTTGIDMPPKGGNPAFTDDDILAIIAYIRTLSASGG